MRRAHHAENQYSPYDNGMPQGQGGESVLETASNRLTDELKGKIQTLKSLSIEIGAEVRDQTNYLGEMDDDFDSAGGFLGKAMGRVKKLAKGSQNYVVLYLLLFSLAIFFFIWILIKFSS